MLDNPSTCHPLKSETSASLLQRLRISPDSVDWQRLVDLYTPLIRGWLRQHSLQDADADDLVQEVMTALVRELPTFHYDRAKGSFRGWLRTLTVNRLRNFWRARHARPRVTGDSDFREVHLNQLEDPHTDLARLWDHEHDQHVARVLLQAIEPLFTPATWKAFRLTALEGANACVAAAQLGTSCNAVLVAKSRVLRRLRLEMQGLTD